MKSLLVTIPKTFLTVVALGAALLLSPVVNQSALALSGVQNGADSAKSSDQPTNLFGDSGVFRRISEVLLFIVGAVSVIMIIIGGFRYVLSGGDSKHVTDAKNTILYAVIGLVVALLAYAAIDFVVNNFSVSTGGSGAAEI